MEDIMKQKKETSPLGSGMELIRGGVELNGVMATSCNCDPSDILCGGQLGGSGCACDCDTTGINDGFWKSQTGMKPPVN